MGWFQGGYWGGLNTQGWMQTVAAAVATTTWNPADKGAGVTLSNNNLRATISDSIVRATQSAPSRSAHVEYTIISGSGAIVVGLYSATAALNGSDTAFASAGNIGYRQDGTVFVNGTQFGGAANALSNGDVVGIDYNKTTGAYAVSRNGGIVVSGTTTSGLTIFPAAGRNGASRVVDLNAGQFAFTSNPNNAPAWG